MINVLAETGSGTFHGVDPFVPANIEYPSGAVISKGTLADIQRDYDVVMFHHSIEHVPDPVAELTLAAGRLVTGGHVIVRTPVVGTYASEHFREHWAQLDAPRHLTLFSVAGISAAAARAGLEVVDVEFDSTDFPLWASERYRTGQPLTLGPPDSRMARARLRSRARSLNARREGDQACFYLRRTVDVATSAA